VPIYEAKKILSRKIGEVSWADKTRSRGLGEPATPVRKIVRSLIQYSVCLDDGEKKYYLGLNVP
jgi:hypothetical protein